MQLSGAHNSSCHFSVVVKSRLSKWASCSSFRKRPQNSIKLNMELKTQLSRPLWKREKCPLFLRLSQLVNQGKVFCWCIKLERLKNAIFRGRMRHLMFSKNQPGSCSWFLTLNLWWLQPVCVCVCIWMCVYVWMYVCVYTQVYICMNVWKCTCGHMCVCFGCDCI